MDKSQVWMTRHEVHSVEMSTLEGYGMIGHGFVELPNEQTAKISAFVPETNDGEITMWELRRDGQRFLIFND